MSVHLVEAGERTNPSRTSWWRWWCRNAEGIAAVGVAVMAATWFLTVVAAWVAWHAWEGVPVLRSLDVVSTEDVHVVRGLVPVGVEGGGVWSLGMVVTCGKATGDLVVHLHFGGFPAYVSVQPMVRTANGVKIRFGAELSPGDDARFGLHSQVLEDDGDVANFIDAAFVRGVWISNGHAGFRNGVPADENVAAVAGLLDCAGGG
ncbi:MAG: hypothetical protein OXD40_02050 [bacterium]|nr:hypothetical protein [bacterium]